ncbi:hypothetical protein CLONEX_00089, partial [[Clostridium] nexile DSM 1787]
KIGTSLGDLFKNIQLCKKITATVVSSPYNCGNFYTVASLS